MIPPSVAAPEVQTAVVAVAVVSEPVADVVVVAEVFACVADPEVYIVAVVTVESGVFFVLDL